MKRALLGALVITVFAGSVVLMGTDQGQGGRRIRPHPTKTLAEQIRPDDAEVILESGYEAPHIVPPPPGKTWLQRRT